MTNSGKKQYLFRLRFNKIIIIVIAFTVPTSCKYRHPVGKWSMENKRNGFTESEKYGALFRRRYRLYRVRHFRCNERKIHRLERLINFRFVSVDSNYSNPVYPTVKGIEKFKGIQLHSHDYKEPSKFANLNVLVIGAGPSGLDISNQISSCAKTVSVVFGKSSKIGLLKVRNLNCLKTGLLESSQRESKKHRFFHQRDSKNGRFGSGFGQDDCIHRRQQNQRRRYRILHG